MLTAWRTLGAREVFRSRWIGIRQETVETHEGRVTDDYYIVEARDVAIVFALTAERRVVLVRQYKHGVREITVELPGGGIAAGEALEAAARRELLEETGYAAAEFRLVATHQRNTTNSAARDWVFLALGAAPAGPARPDEHEQVEVRLAGLGELRRMVRAGEIGDLGTVAAVYRALEALGELGAG